MKSVDETLTFHLYVEQSHVQKKSISH